MNTNLNRNEFPQMMTIKEVAKTNILPENTIRTLVKEKRIPCLMIGNRALINYAKVVEMLNELK